MARTPEYLQQVIISGKRRAGGRRDVVTSVAVPVFRRPSVTSLAWASLDLLTVLLAGVLALRFREVFPLDIPTISSLPNLILILHLPCNVVLSVVVCYMPDFFHAVLWAVWTGAKSPVVCMNSE